MNSEEICREITNWFVKEHSEFVNQNSLKSWADILGIKLEKNGQLDEDGLFQLFVLASLWNNHPTFRTNRGIDAFKATKAKYTLENFKQAQNEPKLKSELRILADQEIGNPAIFNLLEYIANGDAVSGSVWNEIIHVMHLSGAGTLNNDINRLMQLNSLFNDGKKYSGDAYLKVKLFLVFRELRIQFKQTGQFQFHPAICCVSDSHVREALQDLGFAQNIGSDLGSLIVASQTVAGMFCNEEYELYDLPLFFAHKEKVLPIIIERRRTKVSRSTESAGNCPACGSALVWRVAQKTGERYRGCTNFKGGCRWNDRSY
ncbi:MAG: hypothetical protein ACQCN4_13400 [Candidatus Bathyarchaeia archaeon]|jgi:hypothetical protein